MIQGTAEFSRSTWEEGGTLEALQAEADTDGKLIPKYRVVNPGWNDRKGSGYMYLLIYGIIEEKPSVIGMKESIKERGGPKAFGAFPLGVGKSKSSPQELLEAIQNLDITVRRTAGAGEKLVMGTSNISPILAPWKDILYYGAIFSAIKVCNNVDVVQVDKNLRLRPVFLTITMLTDAGCYRVPRSVLEFRLNNAISFNLLVELLVGSDLSTSGVKGMVTKEGERVTTFMVHIGNFVRHRKKEYSIDYCRQKVDKMDLRFSLGAVGGLSLHIKIAGKMSKTLRAQLGYKSLICYSLMDTNPYLNRLMWKSECSIHRVIAVFQPSVPKEFKIYDDILIDHTGKILKQ
ncbi:matrix protein [Parajeilongvirus brazilense]|nr:matrix protein [Diaemus bat paramyxovirus]